MVEALFVEYPEREEEWPKQNMLNRLSKPEEYRGAAVFLISDASSFSKCALSPGISDTVSKYYDGGLLVVFQLPLSDLSRYS
jgi:hypothetical protein